MEDPEEILKDMEAGVSKGSYSSIIDRKEAIEMTINNAQKGDVIVIAGKGHETYQIIGDKTVDFDDRDVARIAIRNLK
jgi:UDP-N-acetylmuramoyl-L-alanyl-D-glutamate--2,6-diaminopimelate ligase